MYVCVTAALDKIPSVFTLDQLRVFSCSAKRSKVVVIYTSDCSRQSKAAGVNKKRRRMKEAEGEEDEGEERQGERIHIYSVHFIHKSSPPLLAWLQTSSREVTGGRRRWIRCDTQHLHRGPELDCRCTAAQSDAAARPKEKGHPEQTASGVRQGSEVRGHDHLLQLNPETWARLCALCQWPLS